MRVYLDSGPFLDYLKYRTPYAEPLRTERRRGREPDDLARDMERCLEGLGRDQNSGFTSTLTFVELELALNHELRERSKGIIQANKSQFILISGRAIVEAVFVMCEIHKIQTIPLKDNHVEFVLNNREMKARRLSLPDAIHMSSAIIENADAILTTDWHLIQLDGVFTNSSGETLRCVDSDRLPELL